MLFFTNELVNYEYKYVVYSSLHDNTSQHVTDALQSATDIL